MVAIINETIPKKPSVTRELNTAGCWIIASQSEFKEKALDISLDALPS